MVVQDLGVWDLGFAGSPATPKYYSPSGSRVIRVM